MGQGFDFMALMPLVAIFAIFYFMLIRPQQKKLREHQNLLNNLRRGDRVVTNGGIIGTINKLTNDREVLIEIAEGVRIRLVRSMITEVLSKIEAANSDKDQTGEDTVTPKTVTKKDKK